MTEPSSGRRWPSLPLSAQILALLMAGLVAAQLTTLALTLLWPPAPPQQHSLADIAATLRGKAVESDRKSRPLVRTQETRPPSLQSPGWLVSQRATTDLARLLEAPEGDVRLLFYAPPPLAGALPPGPAAREDEQAALNPGPRLALAGFVLAQADPPPGPPGGMGRRMPDPSEAGPGERSQGNPSGPALRRGDSSSGSGGVVIRRDPSWREEVFRARAAEMRAGRAGAPTGADLGRGPQDSRPRVGQQGPALLPGQPAQARSDAPGRGPIVRPAIDAALFLPRTEMVASPAAPPSAPPARAEAPRTAAAPPPRQAERLVRAPAPTAVDLLATPPAPQARTPAPAAAQPVRAAVAERALPPPLHRSLFGLAPASYVEGDFVAALRVGPDQWLTVQPEPEGFPNSWQKRVLLWFAVSFMLVAPAGYLFSRRLTAPLRRFAAAAETLGRDPSAPVAVTGGPAEVGVAARAFDQMQGRLKRYVEDRTGMIRAISHDLRTPLARMRFRLERAPPELRAGLTRDVAQMEEMISSVLAFMREEAASGARQRVDLRSILECVVDDAEAGGGAVSLEPGAPAEVEVNVLGVQRVFENLVDNALKYGERAQVRLFVDEGEVVTEIVDRGPGLDDAELEHVFQPFYRSPEARASNKAGIGLGLAVSRSTIVAHGGQVKLRRVEDGLAAEVRLPLASRPALAA